MVVYVFCFSYDCVMTAQMAKLDLNNEDEKSLVDGVFSNAMDSLSDDDKKLPQVFIKSDSCKAILKIMDVLF